MDPTKPVTFFDNGNLFSNVHCCFVSYTSFYREAIYMCERWSFVHLSTAGILGSLTLNWNVEDMYHAIENGVNPDVKQENKLA